MFNLVRWLDKMAKQFNTAVSGHYINCHFPNRRSYSLDTPFNGYKIRLIIASRLRAIFILKRLDQVFLNLGISDYILYISRSKTAVKIYLVLISDCTKVTHKITIYAPMIYTAPCIMFWMRAYPLRGEVEGGWALEFSSFLGPVKWERADRFCFFYLYSNPSKALRCCRNLLNPDPSKNNTSDLLSYC